jgi:asparaginyl-tRNA synthetase
MKEIERMIRFLVAELIKNCSDSITAIAGKTTHLENLIKSSSFPRIRFQEEVALCGGEEVALHDGFIDKTTSTDKSTLGLTAKGEVWLLEKLDVPAVFITHYPGLGVPFYQANDPENPDYVLNADLLLRGVGETVGCGQRHHGVDEVLKSLDIHCVDRAPYEWYVDMKRHEPLTTSGWGMGVERFLQYVLCQDIRQVQLYPVTPTVPINRQGRLFITSQAMPNESISATRLDSPSSSVSTSSTSTSPNTLSILSESPY